MRSLLPRSLTPLIRALLSGPNYLPEAPPPNSPVEVKLQHSTLGGHEPSSVAPLTAPRAFCCWDPSPHLEFSFSASVTGSKAKLVCQPRLACGEEALSLL